MLSDDICCKQITGELCSAPAFGRMTGLGWYDGVTLGIVVCEKCSTEYYFFLIDWSSDQRMRVFALQELATGTTERLCEVVGDRPPGPVWFPRRLITSSEEDTTALDDAIDRIVVPTSPPRFVAAWASHGDRVLCARRLEDSVPREMSYFFTLETARPEFDWLAYLGLIA